MDLSKEGVSGRDLRGNVERRKFAACVVVVGSFVVGPVDDVNVFDCSDSLGLRIDWARPTVGRVGLVKGTKCVGNRPVGDSTVTGTWGGTWCSRCGDVQGL